MKKMTVISLVLSLVFLFVACGTRVDEEPRTYYDNDTDLTAPEQVRNEVRYDDATRYNNTTKYNNDIRTTIPQDTRYDNEIVARDRTINDGRYDATEITTRDNVRNDTNYDVDTRTVDYDRDMDGRLLQRASRDAKNVCTRLDGMPGVDDVSCVVSGDDCFVSVQLDENCTENQKNAVLNDTYMVCKNTNQTLQNVYLNFESDMHNQIKGYMNQINSSGSTTTPKISQIKSSMQDVTIR